MLIGILTPHDKLTETERAFITVAQSHGHQGFIFNAKNVDFLKRRIVGKTLKNGQVIEHEFSFPDLVQNRLTVREQDVPIYVKLAKELYFTTHHIETKVDLYQRMHQHPVMNKYVIESAYCHKFLNLKKFIDQYQYVIIKPASSHQAKGIYTIQVVENGFLVKILNESQVLTEYALQQLFEYKLSQEILFVSPFFQSKTNHNLTVGFRLLMVLGEQGKWQKIKFYPYLNINENQDIANEVQGAFVSIREELFLKQYYPKCSYKIINEIDTIFMDVAHFMDQLYEWPIDAIGVDIGISQEGEIKIFEINAGPGIDFLAYPVAEQQILYYEWLVNNNKKIEVNNFLPRRYRHYYNQT